MRFKVIILNSIEYYDDCRVFEGVDKTKRDKTVNFG